MTSVYLIRHAEAEGNLYRRCHGWYNSLVTDNGYRQIAALEKRFEGVQIDAVYSSDLFRTMTTAGAIYKPRGLVLHTDKDLREIHSGVWEDKTWGELWQEDPRGLDAFNHSDPAWQVQGSETFGKWYGVTLSAENKKQFLIPEGFAHGFLVLSDEAEFCYKVNDFWHPNDEGGMAWNDPEIGIEWPELVGEYKGTPSAEGYTLEDGTKITLSDKDQKWLGFKDTFKF